MYFAASPDKKSKTILERARRTLVPWFVWSLFYGVINILLSHPFIKTDNGIFAALLTGTSTHLWYLPYIFLVSVLFDFLFKTIPWKIVIFLCDCLVLLLFYKVTMWLPWMHALGTPWIQFSHALAGVLIGVLYAFHKRLSSLILMSNILIFIITAMIYSSLEGYGITYSIAILITSLVLLPQWKISLNINWLSQYTLGIYLIHIFWLRLFKKIGFLEEWSLPVMVFLVSGLTIWCFNKIMPKVAKYAV